MRSDGDEVSGKKVSHDQASLRHFVNPSTNRFSVAVFLLFLLSCVRQWETSRGGKRHTAPASVFRNKMFRRTIAKFPIRNKYEETKRSARRIAPFPRFPERHYIDPEFQLRFMDLGPEFNRVWVSLGKGFRRRRTGKHQDAKDEQLYWRPIPKAKQRLYMQRIRAMNGNPNALPARLHKTNQDLVKSTWGPLYTRGRPGMYGVAYAPPQKYDFEYRVF